MWRSLERVADEIKLNEKGIYFVGEVRNTKSFLLLNQKTQADQTPCVRKPLCYVNFYWFKINSQLCTTIIHFNMVIQDIRSCYTTQSLVNLLQRQSKYSHLREFNPVYTDRRTPRNANSAIKKCQSTGKCSHKKRLKKEIIWLGESCKYVGRRNVVRTRAVCNGESSRWVTASIHHRPVRPTTSWCAKVWWAV